MKSFAVFRVAGLTIALVSTGCISYVADLPANASAVDFGGSQGHTGWARYERTSLLRDIRLADALRGGEQALVAHEFALRKSDLTAAVVVG